MPEAEPKQDSMIEFPLRAKETVEVIARCYVLLAHPEDENPAFNEDREKTIINRWSFVLKSFDSDKDPNLPKLKDAIEDWWSDILEEIVTDSDWEGDTQRFDFDRQEEIVYDTVLECLKAREEFGAEAYHTMCRNFLRLGWTEKPADGDTSENG